MLRALRTLVSLAALVGLVWAAFTVDLGGKTFADHADAIGDTPEARQLLDGARSAINPALAELRDRLLGEYVEAPTWIADEGEAGRVEGFEPVRSGPAEPALPGWAEPALPGEAEPALPGEAEPALPGEVVPVLPGWAEPMLSGQASGRVEARSGSAEPTASGSTEPPGHSERSGYSQWPRHSRQAERVEPALPGRAEPSLLGQAEPGLPGRR